MLCAECGARVPLPDSPDAKCGRCGKNPLDVGDWSQVKKLRAGARESWWTRRWW